MRAYHYERLRFLLPGASGIGFVGGVTPFSK